MLIASSVNRRCPGVLIRVVGLLLVSVMLAGCLGSEQSWQTKDISGMMPDLQFTLTDENGDEVTADDYEGTINVLYFGYTYCPDVCPTTLARLAAVRAALPDSITERLRILFISVDPARDTPERLRVYTDAFGPRVVGLTGNGDQLRALTKRYRTTYSYGEKNEDGDYLVTHSSALYVFDEGKRARLLMRAYGGSKDSIEAMTADLKQLAGG